MLHFIEIKKLLNKKFLFWQFGMKRLIYVVNFYRQYSNVFDKDTLLNATYLTQESPYYQEAFADDFARLDEAKRLMQGYSKAAFVITSRIHCALPCLGMETPVFYTENDDDAEVSQCRLRGLKDLFNVIECKDGRIKPKFEAILPISRENCPKNKSDWKQLFESLDKRCSDFMNG